MTPLLLRPSLMAMTVALGAAVAACGSTASPAAVTPAAATSAAGSATATPAPATQATPAVPAGWVSEHLAAGALSVSHPANLKAMVCDNADGGLMWIGTQTSLPGCAAAGGDARYEEMSFDVTQSAPTESAAPTVTSGVPSSSSPIVVAGVHGTRTVDGPIPEGAPCQCVPGSIFVTYAFTTGGRSYSFMYTRDPGQPDLTATFDQMVQSTVRFA